MDNGVGRLLSVGGLGGVGMWWEKAVEVERFGCVEYVEGGEERIGVVWLRCMAALGYGGMGGVMVGYRWWDKDAICQPHVVGPVAMWVRVGRRVDGDRLMFVMELDGQLGLGVCCPILCLTLDRGSNWLGGCVVLGDCVVDFEGIEVGVPGRGGGASLYTRDGEGFHGIFWAGYVGSFLLFGNVRLQVVVQEIERLTEDRNSPVPLTVFFVLLFCSVNLIARSPVVMRVISTDPWLRYVVNWFAFPGYRDRSAFSSDNGAQLPVGFVRLSRSNRAENVSVLVSVGSLEESILFCAVQTIGLVKIQSSI
ncbi:hypothetical protein Tco_1065531 [Tanacetum coccineum]